MKLKNMWKRFWTLDVHNHEGFTLVELIIVIAILAILSTGAIAGYSAYVTKANKTADQAMISEIKTVLSLKAYSEGVSNADFVILTQNGAEVGGDFAAAALEEAYGSNWPTALKLKSDEWTAGSFLVNVQDAPLIAGSTFFSENVSPDDLMQAVTDLTGAASNVISNYEGDVATKLENLGMTDAAEKLAATNLTPGTEEYNTAVSNLLIGEFAGLMDGATVDEAMNTPLVDTALLYASLYAYCAEKEDTTTIQNFNSYLSTATSLNDLSVENLSGYIATEFGEDFATGFGEYLKSETGAADREATVKIMGAVNNISDKFTSAEDLSNANLYVSDSVSQHVNDYVGAIKAVAQMDPALREKLQTLDADAVAVVVTVSKDGTVA